MGLHNPLLEKWETPFCSVPFDEILPKHFLPALKESIDVHNEEIEEIVGNLNRSTFENTILTLERAGFLFSRIVLIFDVLKSSYFAKELKDISEKFGVLVSEHSTKIILNKKLFGGIQEIYDRRDELLLDEEDMALLRSTFRKFEEAGANCPDKNRIEFSRVNARISILKDRFAKNLQSERGSYLFLIEDEKLITSMPEDDKMSARKLAEERGKEGFGFIPSKSLYPSLMKYCVDRDMRKRFFNDTRLECCHGGDTDNREVVREIVNLRLRRARLLRLGVHADTVLKNRMLKTKKEVVGQTELIFETALPRAHSDVKKISDFAKEIEGEDFELMPWDFMFYSEGYQKEKMGLDPSEVKSYFELDGVVDGVFRKAEEMYGLSFLKRDDVPVYNEDVVVYEVLEDGKHVGLLDLDLFSNAGLKLDGARMMESAFQSKFPNFQRPHIHVCTNYNKPAEGGMCLLTQDEVKTFLHEFGHALHGLLSDVRYASLCGTGVAWDFVELPSQVMENFFFERDFLDSFAKHYDTGELLPEEMFSRMIEGRNFNKGYWYVGQAALTMIDNYWHTIEEDFQGNILDVEEEILDKLDLFPIQMLSHRTTTFLHPFSLGYDMGYYSYANAEILDADMFQFWKEKGFSKEVFSLFRKHILSKGGSCEERDMYRKAVGRLPDVESFLDARVRGC